MLLPAYTVQMSIEVRSVIFTLCKGDFSPYSLPTVEDGEDNLYHSFQESSR